MKRRELSNLGLGEGDAMIAALRACVAAGDAGISRDHIRETVSALIKNPQAYVSDPLWGTVATAHLMHIRQPEPPNLKDNIDYVVWGSEIDDAAHQQMKNACRLPVSVAAALMPDAHVGYGLPIGGVLATENAVIPYAVGVDIACRVKVTVFDQPGERARKDTDRFASILERETRFGVGGKWRGVERPQHDVLDEDWGITPFTKHLKDTAWSQLGTSGSGNHFVEFGEIEFLEPLGEVVPGNYLAVVSHSGSRGPGAQTADHYSRVARALHPELPKELAYLAWLPLGGVGDEYWAAMELMGRFASANHAIIHKKIARAVSLPVLFSIENHHNFAWREKHGGREVIVHRKGATPAGTGVLGVIPGSMGDPGYVVRGRGNAASLNSASHGAGRQMSRTAAMKSITKTMRDQYLRDKGVTLLGGGLDEAPQAYKNINEVIAAQSELVHILARFKPRVVMMTDDPRDV